MSLLERLFHLEKRNTTVATEVRAGIATFLTMSYILLVNPQLLSSIGVPAEDIVISTAVSAGVSTFITACGNLPFGLASGVGLSAYLVYGLVLGDGLTVKEAYTSCFVAGVLLLVFSLTGITQFVMKIIPRSVKLATIVGMGLQIAMVGMTSVDMVVPNEHTIVGLGPLKNYKIWVSFLGLQLIGSLLYHQVTGAILIAIMFLTVLSWTIENSFPSSYVQFPQLQSKVTDFISFENYDPIKCFPGILAFLFIGVIDVSGVIFGMSSLAQLTEKDGNIPGSKYAFLGASLGSCVSAATGGTPIIVYVESAAGIKEGGRTGLTAVVIGCLFFASLIFAPLFASVPVTATSPVAILIGAMMMSQATEIDWDNMSEAIPGFLTLVIMPFTFSITNGIIFGLMSAIIFYITTGQFFIDIKKLISGKSNDITSVNANESSSLTPIDDLDERQDNSFIDFKPMVRTPSLILRKKDATSVRKAKGMSVEVSCSPSDSNGISYLSINKEDA